jgi:nitroreductase
MIDGISMLEMISARQSDRKYKAHPVEREKIERITEAGRLSPSACNGQPWKFIVVDDPGLLKKMAEAVSAKVLRMNLFVGQAPLMLVVVREKSNLTSSIGGSVKSKDYSLIDIGISASSICLQAEAEGLGSCIIGWFDENAVRKILSIPRSKRVELIITIGYPDSDKRTKKRKTRDEVVSHNRY